MRNKTKWLAVALCLTLFALVAIGSGSSDSGETKEISNVEQSQKSGATDLSTSENSSEKSEEENTSVEVTIDEQVIYNENDIVITATGIEDSWLGTELKLLIENNSSESITVQARNANVNGYMVETMMSADVAAGKKANDSLTFETSGLKECGIENIATMEFYFHIFDSETWDEIVDTNVIKLDTSIADGYVQNYDDSGDILLDNNGIKIIGKGLSSDSSFFGPGVVLYIENNSDKDVTIQVRDVSA
nr:hypothetical protein [Eubacterium sp.]